MTRIALAQSTATDDVARNLRVAETWIADAAREGADLLAFPEVFLYVGDRRGKIENAIDIDSPLVGRFREAAARHRMLILLGSVHERIPGDAERVHNTSVLIGDDGTVLAVYRKLKLFDASLPGVIIRESDTIAAGKRPPPVVDTRIGPVGLTICFDLRFPEIYVALREAGARIVFVPSNFTEPTGRAHWDVLLRARAIEGQFFVAAPAQVGRHGSRQGSFGHSLVVDPWGSVLVDAGDATGLAWADIDLAEVDAVRARVPIRR